MSLPREAGESLLGPLVVGNQLLFALFGVLSVQTYFFYIGSRDRTFIRTLVYVVYAVMLVQIILAGQNFFSHFAYPYTVNLTSADLGWLYVPVLGGTVGAVVQMFYAWRISVLSNNRIGPCLLLALSITSACSAYVSAAFGSTVPTVTTLNSDSPGLRIASTIWYATSAVCDVSIAVYMTYLLTRTRSAVSSTREAIGRIVRLTVETNTLTASVAVATLVLLLVLPGKTYFTSLALILPSIYVNTFLVMLNLRYRVVQPGTDDCELSVCRMSLSIAVPSSSRPRQSTLVSFPGGDELQDGLQTKNGSDELIHQRDIGGV
ncbi:hypothetical protein L218DRAFT_1001173 [Marasmius fiardii PR-910]|nr:hypothetical protein L218DRAFT_1001173 [Marasmius fiardii PR-910]